MSETSGKLTAETEKAVQLFEQWTTLGKPYATVFTILQEMPSELLIVAHIQQKDGKAEFRTARYTLNSDT